MKKEEGLAAPIQKLIDDMVLVEGGTFLMGSDYYYYYDDDDDYDYPIHAVTLDTYHIAKYPITQAQWVAVMGNNPSRFKGDDLPVEKVSCDDVQVFLQKLNQLTAPHYIFSLPTEAQWEYAARGGKHSKGYQYAGSNNIDEVAWYGDNSGSKTQPVGQKNANELGLYDMSGNVWEWCNDWYDKAYYRNSPSRNPVNTTPATYRVLRGGSWGNLPQFCRVAYRNNFTPTNRTGYYGFRIAL